MAPSFDNPLVLGPCPTSSHGPFFWQGPLPRPLPYLLPWPLLLGMASSYGESKHNILALVGKANKANPRFPSLIAATIAASVSHSFFLGFHPQLLFWGSILMPEGAIPPKPLLPWLLSLARSLPSPSLAAWRLVEGKSERGKRCLPHLVTQQWRGDQYRHSRLRYCKLLSHTSLSFSTCLSMVGPSEFFCIEEKCRALPRRRGNSICIDPSPPHVLSKNFGFRLSSEKAARVSHMHRQ